METQIAEKNPTGNLNKALVKKLICSKGFLKIYFFPKYFQNILPKFQNACWEKYTFQWYLSDNFP